ncbi:LysR family transcriptional regulator [Falsiruegeria mediterranea]|uniref:HTH-type transcriptional regulator MetR n=1 Tax=Falsiruegeria mediterranea M17 TaxID=1200281 RepID=A0A2R8C9P8_9RHOB|nr:LysR family transcriptional regulator [Falsiruegeria mediterranea]SPJ29164.1 HTH-type transcriptional regulator MetR [Falsiruegeria mediterranea M17]
MLYLTLRHYEYACAIAAEGSLSAAAARLNVSQPALSNALDRIDAQLGYPLFIRKRGAALAVTPQGRQFVDRAEALLARATSLETGRDMQPATTRLTLGCFSDLAPFLLAPALQTLRRAYPKVMVSYRAAAFEPLIGALLDGSIDIAVTYDLGLDAGFSRTTLFHQGPAAVLSSDHALVERRGISLRDLSVHPLILSDEGLSAQHMLGLFRRHGLSPVVAHRTQSLEIMRSLAAHGEGVGISYAAPHASHSYDGQPLVMVPIQDRDAREPVILTRHGTGPGDPVIDDAMKILTDALKGQRP